jgi:hypothetical protein
MRKPMKTGSAHSAPQGISASLSRALLASPILPREASPSLTWTRAAESLSRRSSPRPSPEAISLCSINLGGHKGKPARGHWSSRRPPRVLASLQPDLNPIEQVFAKLKHLMRRALTRVFENTSRTVVKTLDPSPQPSPKTTSKTQATLGVNEPCSKDALALQRLLPDGALKVVARGDRTGDAAEGRVTMAQLVNLDDLRAAA